MADFETELIDWLHAQLSPAIEKYDATDGSGVLFPVRVPQTKQGGPAKGIAVLVTQAQAGKGGPTNHRFTVDLEGYGLEVKADLWTVVKELRDRNGDVSVFQPIDLPSWRFEHIAEWVNQYPVLRGVAEDGTLILGSRFIATVKEK